MEAEMELSRGKMYIQTYGGVDRRLFFPRSDAEQDFESFHRANMAEIDQERTWHSTNYDTIEYCHHSTNDKTGVLVEYREASNDDLRKIMQSLKEKGVLAQVVHGWTWRRILHKSEKDRLKTICDEILAE